MHHSSVKTHSGSNESPFGAVALGFLGAASMAVLMLATGHGLVMALLAYSLAGALVTLAAAAGHLVLDAVSARLAPSPRARRSLRA